MSTWSARMHGLIQNIEVGICKSRQLLCPEGACGPGVELSPNGQNLLLSPPPQRPISEVSLAKPGCGVEIGQLIPQMATANPLWGTENLWRTKKYSASWFRSETVSLILIWETHATVQT